MSNDIQIYAHKSSVAVDASRPFSFMISLTMLRGT
jgi:hypothetical protein